MCAVLLVPGEGLRYPGTRGTDVCESQCGLWEPNSGPLPEEQVLTTTEPSL